MVTQTPYEQRQIREIAGWKAEPPALVIEAMEAVSHPMVKLAERFIPVQAVRDAIEVAYRDAEILTHRETVAERARVADVQELRQGDLARCDKLADEFAKLATRNATIRGVSTTASPIVSMVVAMTYALKTVHTIGFCYGFKLDDPGEREHAMQILLVASAGSMQAKQQAVVSLGSLEDVFVEEVVEDMIEEETEALGEQAIEQVAGSSIPLLGLTVVGISSAAVTYHNAYVAKRAFQERWLRENGKVESIAPDPKFARSRLQRAEGVVAGACYWSSYLVSFAATFPVCLLTSILPRQNPAVLGFIDGGAAASRDVHEFKDRIRQAVTMPGATSAAPALLPATA